MAAGLRVLSLGLIERSVFRVRGRIYNSISHQHGASVEAKMLTTIIVLGSSYLWYTVLNRPQHDIGNHCGWRPL